VNRGGSAARYGRPGPKNGGDRKGPATIEVESAISPQATAVSYESARVGEMRSA
jgi:hypothetical protein